MKKPFTRLILASLLIALGNPALAKDQKEFLELHNLTRELGATCGDVVIKKVEPLVWSKKLARVARRHVKRMAKEEKVGHNVGGTPDERLRKGGYKWKFFSENVASGFTNPNDLLGAWLDSPKHCMNIMDSRVTEFAAAEQDGYWVTIFAAPKDD